MKLFRRNGGLENCLIEVIIDRFVVRHNGGFEKHETG